MRFIFSRKWTIFPLPLAQFWCLLGWRAARADCEGAASESGRAHTQAEEQIFSITQMDTVQRRACPVDEERASWARLSLSRSHSCSFLSLAADYHQAEATKMISSLRLNK